MEPETRAIAMSAVQTSLDTAYDVPQDISFTKESVIRTAQWQPSKTKRNIFGNVPLAKIQRAQSAQVQETISVYVALTRVRSIT